MTDPRRPARAAVLALVVATTLAGCGDETSDATDQAVPAAAGATIDGTESFVQLPHGRLTTTVSDAAEIESADLASADDDPGEAVGVDWTWEPGAGVPTQQSGFVVADDVPAEVSVVVDGVTHDLGPAYSTGDGLAGGDAFFVPAEAGTTADDVTVEVDFDGLVQRVGADGSDREAGVAAPLYDDVDDVAPQQVDCDLAVEPTDVTAAPTCDVAVLSLPYVTGLGWAETDGAWTVVDTTVRLEVVTVGDDDVPVAGQSETVLLDGAEPEEVLLDDGSGATLRTQTVFASAGGDAGDLELARTVQVEAPDGGSLEVTLSAALAVATG